jgi:hypothetical protein
MKRNVSDTGHRFNNDLLMNPGDLDRSARAYQQMAHVLS